MELDQPYDCTICAGTLITFVELVKHNFWYVQDYACKFIGDEKVIFINSGDFGNLEILDE